MASSVTLHSRAAANANPSSNPLPQLIQTPSGLAILELQGTINLPQANDNNGSEQRGHELEIGRISFPDYHPETQDASSTAWMKRVHLYIGQHQRLTGEVKKLPRAIAVIRKRHEPRPDVEMTDPAEPASQGDKDNKEDLELVEIVKYKLLFAHRPEPVGTV
ncbi:putative sister chromatid cohesion protein Ctf8 [Astrocystis sublimbata]|nr:putative sister chromatid cohesion protein Ctf8 [Astrocystis sublimbata]